MFKRMLLLEDGTIFKGIGFGSEREMSGEVIFHTAMTGYQEIISNPANDGQLIVMTNPSIGTYGMNRDDFEAVTPSIHGLITREHCTYPSNFRSDETLHHFLKEHDIPGISGIDTRMLTKHIRDNGIMKGIIIHNDIPIQTAMNKLREATPQMRGVPQVSSKQAYSIPGRKERIVLIDLGVKHGILRELTKRNCQVTVVPYSYSVEDILRLKPSGIILSNGPGDPNLIPETIKTVQEITHIPLFGIGLGHQVMALAFGAKVRKMTFGHHGTNYPVQDLQNQQTYLTTQSHHFTVCQDSIEKCHLKITHQSVNDQDIEGLQHTIYPAFSVQFYPEGGPGPDDTAYLYDQFLKMIQMHWKTMEGNVYAKKLKY